MPDYLVKVACPECGEKHSAQIRIFLGDGPAEEKSVADAYPGKALSSSLRTLIDNTICLCPEKGKQFKQTDPEKVFLALLVNSACNERTDVGNSGQAVVSQGDYLQALADAFSSHPNLSPNDRVAFSMAVKAISNNPHASQIAAEVLLSMLFKPRLVHPYLQ